MLRLLVPCHWPVLSLYRTSITTFGNGIDWPFFTMTFRNTEALTAPTLKVISGFDIFRLFLIDWLLPICTIVKTMYYLNLSADADEFKAVRGRLRSDLSKGAINKQTFSEAADY